MACLEHSPGQGQEKVRDLPISSYAGPAVSKQWRDAMAHQCFSVDQQALDLQQRFQELQTARRQEVPASSALQRPASGRQGHTSPYARVELLQDPRIRELQACLAQAEMEQERHNQLSSEQASRSFAEPEEETNQRRALRNLHGTLAIFLDKIRAAGESSDQQQVLASVYSWYQRHRLQFKEHQSASMQAWGVDVIPADARPGVEMEAPLPGSTFYHSSDERARQQTPSHDDGRLSPDSAKLAPAKERLREFEAHRIAGPLTARKLKAAGLAAEPLERPFTPSTATGFYTARTITSARSPTPTLGGNSRPSSALSTTGRPMSSRSGVSGATAEAFSSRWRPSSATSASQKPVAHPLPMPTLEEPGHIDLDVIDLAEPYPFTAAENRMEERWLHQRHKDISDQVLGNEQRTAVAVWAERRARIEEEISRNTEVARFQSELRRQGYRVPDDAAEDIEATDAAEESRLPPGTKMTPKETKPKELQRLKDYVPHYDVSQPKEKVMVRETFERDGERRSTRKLTTNSNGTAPATAFMTKRSEPQQPVRQPLSSRINHLRNIHANLLKFDIDDASNDEGDAAAADFFSTPEGSKHISLSAYKDPKDVTTSAPRNLDEADVLISVCESWQMKHSVAAQRSADCGVTLDEMRFQQLKEAEAVKRVFARRNIPLNAAVLERALVMPKHNLEAALSAGAIFNSVPNLPHNPFYEASTSKKKKAKSGKGKAAAKQGKDSAGKKKLT